MQFIKYFTFLLLSVAILSGCDIQVSNDKASQAPVLDDDYIKKAIAYLKKVIEDEPSNPDAYYKVAKIYSNNGDHRHALWFISEALKRDSLNYNYLLLFSNVTLNLKDYKSASKAAYKAERMNHHHLELYHILAQIKYKEGHVERAADYLNRAINNDPNNYQAYNLKGNIDLQLQDTIAAEESFIRSLKINPEFKEAYDNLMDLFIKTRQFTKAKHFVKDYSSNMDVKDVNAILKEAVIFKSTGNLEISKAMLKGLLYKDSTFLQAYIELASISKLEKSIDSTEFYYMKALNIKDDLINVRFELAKIMEGKKLYINAIREYEKILEIDPENNLAIEELEKVKGKLAYLQRVEQERQRRPVLAPIERKKL
jgi:tetratricopeptide (TPR) repeat protein